MKYRNITGTDLNPSALILGSHEFGSSVSREDSFALMDYYVESGGNLVDTADLYADWQCETPGMSETTIGKWLADRKCRDRMIVATKGGSQTHIWPYPRLSREELYENLVLSLSRLGVDYVDLFWLHVDDPDRTVDEILETMESFRKDGLLRFYGASNWSVPRLREADSYAKEHGIRGFVASQIHWSLADFDPAINHDSTHVVMNDEIYQYHLETGLTQIPYTPQASGFFSGVYSKDNPNAGKADVYRSYNLDRNWQRLERAQKLAAEMDCSANQVALAYLINQPFPVFPIIGCWKMERLKDSIGAGDIYLTPEQVKYLKDG